MKKYLKSYIGPMLLFALCSLVFTALFALYKVPVKAAVYPALICALFIAVYILLDILRKRRRFKELKALASLPPDLLDRLKSYQGEEDELYREIITALCEKESEREELLNSRYCDMIDYYTTWVHQIKTPIASMRLTLAGEDSLIARRAGEDLLSIEQYVEMVLCYLRLDSDSTDYVFRECDIDRVIKASLRKFSGQFIAKGLRLDYKELGIKIVTDEKWLAFVIEQVLSNAIKYTPSGFVAVYGENGRLCIKDSGIGIEKSDLPRIFEKGYTGLAGREDKRASGLGLYLCRRICANLGHEISAESEPGKGTVIMIDLNQSKTRHE